MTRKFLAIDSNYEPLTQAGSTYREVNVHGVLVSAGLSPVVCNGSQCQKAVIEPLAVDPGVVYVTGVGHGTDAEFQGYHNWEVLAVGDYDPAVVNGKIVHLVSCSCAQELGPDLVSNGCLAFIGYDASFVFDPNASRIFFECDAQIDLALARGATASEAIAVTQAYFDTQISKATDPNVVGYLRFNKAHLCGPTSDPATAKWGQPNAALG